MKIMFNGVMYREIVIPYNLGYGSRPAGSIKGFSTLIFDVTPLAIL